VGGVALVAEVLLHTLLCMWGEQWLNHPNTADMWLPRFLPLHMATSWFQLGLQSWTIHKQQLHQWRTVWYGDNKPCQWEWHLHRCSGDFGRIAKCRYDCRLHWLWSWRVQIHCVYNTDSVCTWPLPCSSLLFKCSPLFTIDIASVHVCVYYCPEL